MGFNLKQMNWNRLGLPPLTIKACISIFLIVFISIAFFTEREPYGSSTYAERYFEMRSIVEDGTFAMDKYRKYLGNDQGKWNGHTYSSHVPGMSVMLIPSYLFIAKPFEYILSYFDFKESERFALSAWAVQISVIGTVTALSMVCLMLLFMNLGASLNQAYWGTLLSFFATPIFPFSTIGFTEALILPGLIFSAFFFNKLFGSDDNRHATLYVLLLGISIALVTAMKPSNALFAIAPGLCFFFTRKIRIERIALYCAPILVAIGLLLLHNKMVFGGWFEWPLQFYAPYGGEWRWYDKGGLPPLWDYDRVSFSRLLDMLALPGRGILFNTPLILLSILGIWHLARKQGKMVFTMLTGFCLMIVFFLGFKHPFSGANMGWRLINPTLVFLIIPAVYWMITKTNWKNPFILALFGWSLFLNCTAGLVGVWADPKSLSNAFINYTLPKLLDEGPLTIISYSGELALLNSLLTIALAVGILAFSLKRYSNWKIVYVADNRQVSNYAVS